MTNEGSRSSPSVSRRLLVIRHGERIDFTFNQNHGDHWVHKAFDQNGKYTRFNINMPKSVPARKDGPDGFIMDTPLTEMGYLQAKITGRALKDAGVVVSQIYSSCALRCVQTSVGVLKGMAHVSGGGVSTTQGTCQSSSPLLINVEPGLFEWGSWFQPAMPTWMKVDELQRLGYPVNTGYSSIVKPGALSPSESLVDYYERSYEVVQQILARHPAPPKPMDIDGEEAEYVNIDSSNRCSSSSSSSAAPVTVLVAHGASLDTCTRQLTGKPARDNHSFFSVLHRTPYLSCCQAIERRKTGGVLAWEVSESPILPFQHSSNGCFDWRVLNS